MKRAMSACLAVFLVPTVVAAQRMAADTLDKRPGGYDGIAAVTDDFI